MCCSRRAPPSFPLVLVLLLASLTQAGCNEPETFFELGPRFAPEAPPPGQARIYLFWPTASPPVRGVYHLAAPTMIEQLLPGGYLSYSAVPGRIAFQIERSWDLSRGATAGTPGPVLAFSAERGQIYYLRVVPHPGLVDQLALEPVPAATGEGEISRCRLLRRKSIARPPGAVA